VRKASRFCAWVSSTDWSEGYTCSRGTTVTSSSNQPWTAPTRVSGRVGMPTVVRFRLPEVSLGSRPVSEMIGVPSMSPRVL
jgi:hypothetical protein